MARTYVQDGKDVYRVLIVTEHAPMAGAFRPEGFTSNYSYGPYGSLGAANCQATRHRRARYSRETTRTVTVQKAAIEWEDMP